MWHDDKVVLVKKYRSQSSPIGWLCALRFLKTTQFLWHTVSTISEVYRFCEPSYVTEALENAEWNSVCDTMWNILAFDDLSRFPLNCKGKASTGKSHKKCCERNVLVSRQNILLATIITPQVIVNKMYCMYSKCLISVIARSLLFNKFP